MEWNIVISVLLFFAVQDSTQDVRVGKCVYYIDDCDDYCWDNMYKGGYCDDSNYCMCRKDLHAGTCYETNLDYYRRDCNAFCTWHRYNGGYCDEKNNCICRRDIDAGSCVFTLAEALIGGYLDNCKKYCLKNNFRDSYCDKTNNRCICRIITLRPPEM